MAKFAIMQERLIHLVLIGRLVMIHKEQALVGNRTRPVLAPVWERIGKGDTLVVVRIDRLTRSLSRLLWVIERLEAKSAFFR